MATPKQKLYEEMKSRFPELSDKFSNDKELPYLLMDHLADWLKELKGEIPSSIADRVAAFVRWCESQPRGKTADDDMSTILAVGFYEHLFDSAKTRRLLPRLIPKSRMIESASYLKQWIGAENYEKALREYK